MSGVATDDDAPRLLPVSTGREALAVVRPLLRRRLGPLAACVATFVVAASAGLVPAWTLGRVVDAVRGVAEGAVAPGAAREEVTALVGWTVLAVVTGAVATAVSLRLLARVAEPVLADLREQAVDRALHHDIAEVEAAGAGDLLSRVGDDVRLVTESFTEVVPLVVTSVLAVVLTSGGLFVLDWRLGLAGLVAAPFYLAGLRWYLPRSGPYYRRERAANGERAQALLTGVHASRTLRSFGLAGAHQERVDAASWRSASISIDVYRLLTRFWGRSNRAELVGLLAILVTGFALVRAEEVTVGAVTTAALLFHRLFNPVGALLALFDEVQSAGASLTRITGLARLAPAPPGPAAAPAGTGVEVRDLRHAYVPGRPALDGVSLRVPAGGRVALVGASGAGKTTLGAVLAKRLRPDAGEVRTEAPVALVTQEVHVFAGSVRDNLTLADPTADDARLAEALTAVGAWGSVAALPDGLDTAVGDGAAPIPPALAQQLALARVLLADPPVVVLDEATAEAGSWGARLLERAALAATEGRTAVTIAHRLTQAATADRVVVLDAGRVVEEGTHEELVAAGGAYAALWTAWSGAGR